MGERAPVTHGVYVLVSWDEGRPLVRHYEDKADAMDVYRTAVATRDHAYLYVTDEMGNFNIILELD